jgi:hypothetical protein
MNKVKKGIQLLSNEVKQQPPNMHLEYAINIFLNKTMKHLIN